MKNNIKIINRLSIIALLLFFLGQGVWLYHVRELKAKEFKTQTAYLLKDVIEKYLTDEELYRLAYGKTFPCQRGWLRKDNIRKCIPTYDFYRFSQFNLQLFYDRLYENLELDIKAVDTLFQNALKKSDMPPVVGWGISERDSGTFLLTCGNIAHQDNRLASLPVNLGCVYQHQLIAFFETPLIFPSFGKVLLVEVFFLIAFVLSMLWQWCYIRNFWKEAEVKVMGTAHLEHELKKPIAILLNAVEDLAESGKQVLTAREQLKLKMMKMRLIKMAGLTDTLLTVCSNSTPEFKCVTLDVRREMETVLELFEVLKPYADIRLRITPEAESAWLDEFCFCYMVINLVDNAIKYSGDHPLINIDCCKENDKFVLAVRDKGIGIPKRKQKRIFRAFYRMNNRCVQRTTGFGLGLTFVRKVVDTYGGEIQVESKVGEGSSFIIVLPQ